MLLGGIHIPEALLSAHQDGRLVIFTGAGISMDPPSSLPNFSGLAELVANKVGSAEDPKSDAWKTQLDAFMGKLDDDARYDIHRLVKGIVTSPTSAPNLNHQALARIAAHGIPRLVTTNYDLHLERELRVHCPTDPPAFRAPAMPLGDDFWGLVYLHGSADSDADSMVVTDRDFSKAYFHAAWAARFLERMFSEYVVLFVGYSHSDVVMKYLGLGLGPRAERYVITDNPHDEIWTRLRIKTLEYPKGQHAQVTKCLIEWAELAEMGLLEHRQRIRTIVSRISMTSGHSVDLFIPPAELSYLEDAIRRPDRVGFFCEYADGPHWLDWVAEQEPFTALFGREPHDAQVTGRLAGWFARLFAYGDEEISSRAWTVLARSGGTLGAALWNALAFEMHRYPSVRPPHVLRWVWLLLEQEHVGCNTRYWQFALAWDGVWEDRELSVAILEHLMAPRLIPELSWGPAALTVDTRGDLYWLDAAWAKLRPELESRVLEVFPAVERSLTRHLILEKAAPGRRLGFSWRRPSIGDPLPDRSRHRDPMDSIIDAARDCVEQLWQANPDFAQQVVDRWIRSEHWLLKRLAVHGVCIATTLDADQRVRFVLDHGLVNAPDTRPEVFHLLGEAAQAMSPEIVDELLTAYAPASTDINDQFNTFATYDLLERSGVVSARLAAALVSLKAEHGFTPEENWGTTTGVTISSVTDRPPMSTEGFSELVKKDAAEAVQFLLSFEARVIPRGQEATREDAVSLLRSTVREYPTIGLDLWPHLEADEELRGAIISAWGHTADPEHMEAVLTILRQTDLGNYGHQVGQFLLFATQAKDAHWEQAPSVDYFIDAVWKACATSERFAFGERKDWLSVAINAPVGHLLEFWFRIFNSRWTAAGDDWVGLPDQDRQFLDRALGDRSKRGANALTHISGRLELLDQADTAWCRGKLLPLRDWSDPEVAEPFWWGVLSFAHWNNGLAADGLVDGLVETARHLDVFTIDQRRRWADILASVAIRCEAPSADAWLPNFTAIAHANDRERWIESLVDELEQLDEAARVATWDNWLSDYWRRRTEDDPTVFEPGEMDAFASVAPLAPAARLNDAVALVEATTAGFNQNADASLHVTDSLIDSDPEAVSRYYTHLMRNTQLPFYGEFELGPKLNRLVRKLSSPDGLKAAALRLGINLD